METLDYKNSKNYTEDNVRSDWHFPTDKVNARSRIILYGAGNVGKSFYRQIRRSDYCEVILWVDKDTKEGNALVSSPDKIWEASGYDFIVIAIANLATANRIKDSLIKKGIDGNKVILLKDTNSYHRLDEMFQRMYEGHNTVRWIDSHESLNYVKPLSVTSMICNQEFFDNPFAIYWAEKVHENFVDLMRVSGQLSDDVLAQPIVYHRKLWEFIYICQCLYENGMLSPGKKGVAFGVGTECLPDLFASLGCEILATDLCYESASEDGWTDTLQNTSSDYLRLNKYGFCNEDDFKNRVTYRDVDMNDIPDDIGGYDFCWSACALEHLGSLEHGMKFIENSMKTLKPRGIAVHTTEYNMYSDDLTFESGVLSLFRKSDILQIIERLEKLGNHVYPMDWHYGTGVVDEFIDMPPFSKKDMHLRLYLEGFPCTSIGLIIQKGNV